MKQLQISEIFNIENGNKRDLNKLDVTTKGVAFISRTGQNNGHICDVKKISEIIPYESGSITVALGGSLLSTFVQSRPFYTAQNIKVLTPKDERMPLHIKLAYCTIIGANKFRYATYGREANKTFDSILVPDIDYAESCVKNLPPITPPSTESFHQKKCDLKDREWGYFNLKDLFRITGSKTNLFTDLEESDSANGYPYVSTQATNNGVNGFVDTYTEDGNVLTIDSAVLGYCAYQEKPFSASDHVEKLIPEFKINKYIAMFLVAVINQEQYRYNYGRKCSQTRLKANQIKLPCTKEGKPDWEFMENFIKSQPCTADL